MIKKAIRYFLSFILYYCGIIALLRFCQRKEMALKVLVYHKVNNDFEGSSPVLTIERFKQQMIYLKNHYRVINLGKAGVSLNNSGSVAVTFDDGYRDIFDNVLPIIKSLNIPITVFLTSGCLGDGKMLWTDELYFSFKEQNRLKEFYGFKENLKQADNSNRMRTLRGASLKEKRNLMLNFQQVKELSKDDHIEIGSHTQTHPILTQTETEVARREIAESKKDIEQLIGRPVFGFSYPAGKFNQATMDLVKQAGYSYACCVDARFNSKDSDIYALSRINIDSCPVFVFAVEICGVLNWIRRTFSRNIYGAY